MAMFLGNADLQAQGRSGQGGKGDKGGPAGRGGQERGRGWDPGDMRARMMERMQEQFGFSDAEFKAIRPLIEDVQTKQREVLGGRMSSMFRSFTGRSSSRGGRDESNLSSLLWSVPWRQTPALSPSWLLTARCAMKKEPLSKSLRTLSNQC